MTTTSAPTFTDKAFDILRHAVTLARNHNIKHVAVLRAKLQQEYPQHLPDIEAALQKWAEYARTSAQREYATA